ncbi:MAG: hypothetical protein AAF318_04125 [Pseudomonadota bacterium]
MMASDDPLRDGFVDRLAASTLSASDAPGGLSTAAALAKIRADDLGDVVPVGLLRLYRAVRAAEALGHSPAARAAASDETMTRAVGPYAVTVTIAGTVAIILVALGGAPEPSRLEVLTQAGERLAVPLEAAAGGESETLIPAAKDARSRRMLTDPTASFYLF